MGLLQLLRGMVTRAETSESRLLKMPLQLVLKLMARDLDRIAQACHATDDPDLVLFRRIVYGLVDGTPDAVRGDWDRYVHEKTDKEAHRVRMKMLTDKHGRNGLRAYNCEEKICRFIQAIGIARQGFPPADWASRELAREALGVVVQILNDTRQNLPVGDALNAAFEQDLEHLSHACLRRGWTEKSPLKAVDVAGIGA